MGDGVSLDSVFVFQLKNCSLKFLFFICVLSNIVHTYTYLYDNYCLLNKDSDVITDE